MSFSRAHELLSRAIYLLATGAGAIQQRLDECRADIFELGALPNPADDNYIAQLDARISKVKEVLSGNGALALSDDDGVALAKELHNLMLDVYGRAKDEEGR